MCYLIRCLWRFEAVSSRWSTPYHVTAFSFLNAHTHTVSHTSFALSLHNCFLKLKKSTQRQPFVKTFAARRAFAGNVTCAVLRRSFECVPYLPKAVSLDEEALSQGYLSSQVTSAKIYFQSLSIFLHYFRF